MAQDIQVLDEAVAQKTNGIKVFLKSPQPLSQIRGLFERQTGGRGRVNLVLDLEDGREVELVLPPYCLVSPALRQAVKAVPGIDVRDL
jgi:DNA polymerase-3 subunit alpha